MTDWAGRSAAILSVTGPSFRMRPNRFPFYQDEVLCSAHAAAAAALGYDPPSQPASSLRAQTP